MGGSSDKTQPRMTARLIDNPKNRKAASHVRTTRITVILTFALLLGCSTDDRPIRIGTGVWPGFEPLYLARENDLFSKTDIRLVELPSSHEVVNALVAGELEGACISLDEAISVAAEGIPLEIILVFDVSDGADAIVTRNDSSLEHALNSNQLALSFGTTSRLLIDAAITNLGVEHESLALINLAPDQQIKAWNDGDIHTAVIREPHLSQLIEQGAIPVFSSSDIRGRIIDVLVIRQDQLAQHATQIHALTKGFFEARQAMMTMEKAHLAIAQRRLHLSTKELKQIYLSLHMPGPEENYRLLDKDNGRLVRTTETLTSLMQMNGMLSPEASVQLHSSTVFLPVL